MVQRSRSIRRLTWLVSRSTGTLALGVVLYWSASATAELKTVSTFMGSGADNTVAEESDEADGLNAVSEGNNGGQLSTYYTGLLYYEYDFFRNEMIALRFDLSDIPNKALIENASLNLYSYKENYYHPLDIYAVAPGTQNLSSGYYAEDWTEGAEFEDLPGLDFDGNAVTLSLDAGSTTHLGTHDGTNTDVEGALVTFSSASLDEFLQGLGEADSAMFLVAMWPDSPDGYRVQFISRQGSASQTGVVDGDPGQFAPFLQFIVVPEPASWLLLSLGGLLLILSQSSKSCNRLRMTRWSSALCEPLGS